MSGRLMEPTLSPLSGASWNICHDNLSERSFLIKQLYIICIMRHKEVRKWAGNDQSRELPRKGPLPHVGEGPFDLRG